MLSAVVVDVVRPPLGRAFPGPPVDVRPADPGTTVVRALLVGRPAVVPGAPTGLNGDGRDTSRERYR